MTDKWQDLINRLRVSDGHTITDLTPHPDGSPSLGILIGFAISAPLWLTFIAAYKLIARL